MATILTDGDQPPVAVPQLNINSDIQPGQLIHSSTTSSVDGNSPLDSDLPGPPPNFGEVCPGVYRSSFPRAGNFEFLRGLGLKTILTLVSDPYPEANQRFMLSNGIIHIQIPIPPNKDTFDSIPLANMERALHVISDPCNYPILIHCNKGKHRTGCVVGCFRKINDWTYSSIIEEYRSYATHKARKLDEQYMELFDEQAMKLCMGEGDPPSLFVSPRKPLTPGSSPAGGMMDYQPTTPVPQP